MSLDHDLGDHVVGFVRASELYDPQSGERLPYRIATGWDGDGR